MTMIQGGFEAFFTDPVTRLKARSQMLRHDGAVSLPRTPRSSRTLSQLLRTSRSLQRSSYTRCTKRRTKRKMIVTARLAKHVLRQRPSSH